jgi:hypothetical protein
LDAALHSDSLGWLMGVMTGMREERERGWK